MGVALGTVPAEIIDRANATAAEVVELIEALDEQVLLATGPGHLEYRVAAQAAIIGIRQRLSLVVEGAAPSEVRELVTGAIRALSTHVRHVDPSLREVDVPAETADLAASLLAVLLRVRDGF